jgi:hypothetical protein
MRNKDMLDALRLTLCSLFTAPEPPIIWVRTTGRLLEACLRDEIHRAATKAHGEGGSATKEAPYAHILFALGQSPVVSTAS